MIPESIIPGARLYLRGLTTGDATSVYASWLNDPEVNQYLATKSATILELQDYIETKNKQTDALFYGIFIKESDTWIGTIKLEPIDLPNHRAVIAIMLGNKNFWGQGYGPEAMQSLMEYGRARYGITEYELGVRAQNESAIRSYTKSGFVEVKRELGAIKSGDKVYDQVTMIKKMS